MSSESTSKAWWNQSHTEATASGSANKAALMHFKGAEPNVAHEGTGVSHVVLSFDTGDMDGSPAPCSSYKQSYCGDHRKVGRRGVLHSEAALEAVADARAQAAKNRAAARCPHIQLADIP